MPLNPFTDRGMITDANRFFNREKEIEKVLSRFEDGQHIQVVGPNAIGKSSFIWRIKTIGEQRLFYREFIYISLQELARSGKSNRQYVREQEFYKELAIRIGAPVKKSLDDSKRTIAEYLQGRKVTLCLDECQILSVWDGHHLGIRGFLRSLGDKRLLTLLVASSTPLSELPHEKQTSPFYNIFNSIHLEPFNENMAKCFIEDRLKGSPIRLTSGDFQYLYNQSNGHPARLQAICYEWFEKQSSKIKEQDRQKTNSESLSLSGSEVRDLFLVVAFFLVVTVATLVGGALLLNSVLDALIIYIIVLIILILVLPFVALLTGAVNQAGFLQIYIEVLKKIPVLDRLFDSFRKK